MPYEMLPPASFAVIQELDVHPEATQRSTMSYLIFEDFVTKCVKAQSICDPCIVDIGAGKGGNVRNLEAKGFKVIAVEPYADTKEWGTRLPDFRFSSEVGYNTADLIFNSYVLNVVPEDIAVGIIKDIWNILKPKGQALIITRGKDIKDIKAFTHPKYGLLEWDPLEKITKSEGKLTYQKGFTFETLSALIKSIIPDADIQKYPGSSSSSVKVIIIKA